MVDHLAGVQFFGPQQVLHDAPQHGHVAVDPDLQMQVGNGCAGTQQRTHGFDGVHEILRILEVAQARFVQRIDGNDFSPVSLGDLQSREHSRVIGAGVLPHNQNDLGFVNVIERYRAFA